MLWAYLARVLQAGRLHQLLQRVQCAVVMYVFSSFAVLHSVCVWVAKQVVMMPMLTMA